MDKWINEKVVSEITGMALSTLRNHRHLRRGIPYAKCDRSVRYKLQDVLDYMQKRRVDTDESP